MAKRKSGLGANERTTTKTRRTPILAVFLLLLSVGCSKQINSAVPLGVDSEPVSIDVVRNASWVTPDGFETSKINVYIRGEKVNFFDDKIGRILKLLGSPTKTAILGGNENGWIHTATFNEFEVAYYEKTGDMISIDIGNELVAVENDGRIGESWDEVLLKYPGGFSFPGEQGKNYHYLVVTQTKNGPWGAGFSFSFDAAKRVKRIEVGLVTFGK